jgi:hypothetical protein
VEERFVLAGLGVPEHAEHERTLRILDRLDRPVVGPCDLTQALADPTETLVVVRLDRRVPPDELAEPAAGVDPDIVVAEDAWLLLVAFVAPPRATFRIWLPRQIASTGRSRSSAPWSRVSSARSRSGTTPYVSSCGSCP